MVARWILIAAVVVGLAIAIYLAVTPLGAQPLRRLDSRKMMKKDIAHDDEPELDHVLPTRGSR
jgi:hypothetical protein